MAQITERGRYAGAVVDEQGRLVIGSLTERGVLVIGADTPPPAEGLEVSAVFTTKQAFYTLREAAQTTRQVIYANQQSIHASAQRLFSNRLDAFTSKQIMHANRAYSNGMVQRLYADRSSGMALRQRIYANRTLEFATLQTLFSDYIPVTIQFPLKLIISAERIYGFGTKQQLTTTRVSELATIQRLTKDQIIRMPTKQIIFRDEQLIIPTKQIVSAQRSILFPLRISIYDPDEMIIGEITLPGERILTVELPGTRDLELILRGDISMATRHYFNMFSGESKRLRMPATEGGKELDLTNATITWMLRKTEDKNSAIILTKDNLNSGGVEILNAIGGIFRVNLQPADTESLAGAYYHRADIVDAAGNKNPLVYGIVMIT